ncbi:MAG: low-specificity L-threonine aldolase [Candidatus Sumerlaeaceae bacterium]|nr:low-specificity L-threonine aldolase [Candidatus Sumerlaeaceae bacterium]
MTNAIIDLRSDTVTRPTPAMRAAMAAAEVGDDIYGDDPTVNRLQARFAEMCGMEDSLFVPTGTMANQIALKCHTSHGDEVICDANSHILHYETGAPAALSGLSVCGLPGVRGIYSVEEMVDAIRPDNIHCPQTRLVVAENTHNRGGGSVWPLDLLGEMKVAAHSRGLKFHLDGARIYNAVVATGHGLADYAKNFDTMTCCFSKGLGAPVGSIIAGPRDFIQKARRYRKMFGGAMRQSGILAAAAEYALDHHIGRLADDHANAELLTKLLGECAELEVEQGLPTNMSYFTVRAGADAAMRLQSACREKGLLFNHVGKGRCRAVTHLDIGESEIRRGAETIIDAIQS